jgi:hypothetical protein
VVSLHSFKYKITSSEKRDNLASSFPKLYSFYFFLLSYCYKNSSTIMNKHGKSGHLCLILAFRGNTFSFSLFSIILAIYLSYIAFIMLKYKASIPSFFRVFLCHFTKDFFCIYWDGCDSWLCFCLCAVYIYWLTYLKTSLPSYNEVNLIIVHDLFNVFLNFIWKYFVEDFYVYVHQGIWPKAFFFCCILILGLVFEYLEWVGKSWFPL